MLKCGEPDREREGGDDQRRPAEEAAEAGRPDADRDGTADHPRAKELLDRPFERRLEVPPAEQPAHTPQQHDPSEQVHDGGDHDQLRHLSDQARVLLDERLNLYGYHRRGPRTVRT